MILLTSVCNDRYLPGLLVFLHSFKKNHPTWTHPFKVYHRDDLSEQSMQQLKIVYPNLIFEFITDPKFYGKDAHYMCLLPFKEYDYDQVIFLDCDMLCLGPIDDILNVKTGFAACLDYEIKYPKKNIIHTLPYLLRPLSYFNTGVFSIKKTLLNPQTYQQLIQKIDLNIEAKRKKLWDQDIINECFRFEKKSILPYTLNARKNLFKTFFNPEKNGVKIIHYTGGAKPWYVPGCGFLPLEGKYERYRPLHELWQQERQSFKDQYGFDPMKDFINYYQATNVENI
ncbi:MAG: glycosyltransferase [Gammaproteobacteria bacterium]|nr:glycosyltransferase [Gammaproteobacteria bacterium]